MVEAGGTAASAAVAAPADALGVFSLDVLTGARAARGACTATAARPAARPARADRAIYARARSILPHATPA